MLPLSPYSLAPNETFPSTSYIFCSLFRFNSTQIGYIFFYSPQMLLHPCCHSIIYRKLLHAYINSLLPPCGLHIFFLRKPQSPFFTGLQACCCSLHWTKDQGEEKCICVCYQEDVKKRSWESVRSDRIYKRERAKEKQKRNLTKHQNKNNKSKGETERTAFL